jgi:hypothetical protein
MPFRRSARSRTSSSSTPRRSMRSTVYATPWLMAIAKRAARARAPVESRRSTEPWRAAGGRMANLHAASRAPGADAYGLSREGNEDVQTQSRSSGRPTRDALDGLHGQGGRRATSRRGSIDGAAQRASATRGPTCSTRSSRNASRLPRAIAAADDGTLDDLIAAHPPESRNLVEATSTRGKSEKAASGRGAGQAETYRKQLEVALPEIAAETFTIALFTRASCGRASMRSTSTHRPRIATARRRARSPSISSSAS